MRHARSDYDRIQDPFSLIPEDEPVFLLRARDVSAPKTLLYWATRNQLADGDLKLSQLAREQAAAMLAYQALHGAKPADLNSPLVPEPRGETLDERRARKN